MVQNMKSSNGNSIPNQFIIFTPDATFFQSYNSVIVKITFIDGKRTIFLDEATWDYSRTTTKYRNQFLRETTKETEKNIKSGKYTLTNLN